MKSLAQSENIIRFGVFEVNLQTGETRKSGIRIKLTGQPYQILALLLDRPGQILTRHEIRERLWPADTFVEFEDSVHSAVKKLRQTLGDSADNPRFIETVPREGYRFIAPVERSGGTVATGSAIGLASGLRGEKSAETQAAAFDSRASAQSVKAQQRHRRWLVPLTAAAILSLALATYFQWSRHHTQAQASSQRLMLAVLPFENLTGDAGQDYFSDGLTEEMIAQLGRLDAPHLGVIARTSIMQYKRAPRPLPQIGRDLGVQYVLEGSVRRDSDRVRISTQLIRLSDQTRVWSRQYDRALSNLLALQSEVTQEIADEIRLTLGDARKRIVTDRKSGMSPSSYEAYDLYLKGRYFWNKRTPEGFRLAAENFQRAIDKDPQYPRAYAGLADTFGLMSVWGEVPQNTFMPKARAAALKALQIDEGLAEAHASLALVAENYDYDWQTAENEFRRAIELEPSYATAHQWYAECLSWQGRFQEALAESERARQLDPLSVIIATDHAAILYFSRQYDRAITQALSALDMDPGFPRAAGILIGAYVQDGKFAEALDYIEKHPHPDDPLTWAARAYVCGRWGRTAEAEYALAKAEGLPSNSPSQAAPLPTVYAAMGRADQAIAWLQKASAEHSNAITTIKVDPIYDPLRSDPRFQDLLRRVGLAQ